MELPQEYWRQRTLFEIASAIGTLLSLDEATKTRAFGHYARILVDMDLSRHVFDEIRVERERYSFKLAVVYECLSDFCMHCGIIGHNVQACNWLKPSEAKVDNHAKKIITIKKEAANMQYAPKKTLPSISAEVAEVEKSHLIGTHEGNKQDEKHDLERQQAQECPKSPCKDNGAIPDAIDGVLVQHPTSFSMMLNNVQDDIVLGDTHIDDPVLQQVTTNDVAGIVNHDLDQEAEETDDNSSSVPETQPGKPVDTVAVENSFIEIAVLEANDFDASARAIPDTTQRVVILPDEEYDEVVQEDLRIIKQAWAAMANREKPFTPVVSQRQKKKIKQLAWSVGQPYNTRSRGDTSNSSQ
ncbi:uncharacterized protein LOC123890519 [Trifolium pratense]|uniref:uncharacterized protein LOC123890519 n=1 Tax=Trifolium pratense TaxID=57577 RepID=UPI001E696290|nr:uncharacterized protein LOC123890519 [Trifolium pratense]